ncbi:MAG: hypothetical protein QOI66_3948 [Myxococcales bacterium]|nr:hypothetical protein [Myxococcales bacterium]
MATNYKQPRRINTVSVTLFLVLAGGAWVAVSAWPIIALNANVKNELGETLPRAYKANLRPEPESSEGLTRIHDELLESVKKLGVTDPKAEVMISRGKTIAVQVRYKATLTLKGLEKSYELTMEPKVETDAARVEW